MSEIIACVPTSLFRTCGYFEGFTDEVARYLPLLHAIEFRPRDELEDDPSFKQMIPYMLLHRRHQISRRPVWLRYKRGKGGEARLHAMFSIGVGGHVNATDGQGMPAFMEGARREFAEEVQLYDERRGSKGFAGLHFRGLLNDDSTDVGKVHLGVVFTVDTTGLTVEPNEDKMLNFEWSTPEELVADLARFESWSQLCIKELSNASSGSHHAEAGPGLLPGQPGRDEAGGGEGAAGADDHARAQSAAPTD